MLLRKDNCIAIARSQGKDAAETRDMGIWEDDIFLVSYPRSGNTWMRCLLANLLEPDQKWNITNLARVVPDIHEPWPQDWLPRRPRLLKSHLPYHADYGRVIPVP